ncbi:hypothetical protein D3C78_1411930 [compost metagenome]
MIADLAILAGDLVRLAQAAFDVATRHAGAHLLTNHRAAPLTAGDAVAAAILFLAHYDHRCLATVTLACAALAAPVLGQRNRLAPAWGGVVCVLQGLFGICRAALQGVGDVAVVVFAAKHGRGKSIRGGQ